VQLPAEWNRLLRSFGAAPTTRAATTRAFAERFLECVGQDLERGDAALDNVDCRSLSD